MKEVHFLDTTLRDGIKIAGIYLSVEEKVQIARQIASLGVNVMDIGFPAASEDQYKGCCEIVEAVEGPVFCVLARATNPEDLKVTGDVLKRTKRTRIHSFIPVSDVYRRHFIKKSFDETVELAREATRRAREIAQEVEFSLIDVFRANYDDIFKMTEAVITAGANIVNYADTVGCATPWMVEDLIGQIRSRFGKDIFISIHCHNDLGLATSNSIAALKAGADQVHCTINGIGERAGNTPLEEVAIAIFLYGEGFGLRHSINMGKLYSTCKIVERYTGVTMSPIKPLVGQNAFVCDISTPQLGDVQEKPPFYVISPEKIGLLPAREPLDKDVGFEKFAKYVAEMGYVIDQETCKRAYEAFLDIASKKESVFPQDIELIVHQATYRVPQKYKLLYLNVSAGSIPVPHATVQLEVDDQIVQDAGFGHGPVDAAFKTIFKVVKRFPKLIYYEVSAVTVGTDAQGEVFLRLQEDQTVVNGRAASTDVVLASALALVDALNKLEFYKGRSEISELTDDQGWSIIV